MESALTAFASDLNLPPGSGPLAAYEARVAAGLLSRDPEQAKAATRLDRLWRDPPGYHPVVRRPKPKGLPGGLKARLGPGGGVPAAPCPRGGVRVWHL